MISILILLAGAIMSGVAINQLNETRKVLTAPKLPFVPYPVVWSLAGARGSYQPHALTEGANGNGF